MSALSVVIPTYNRCATLKKAITSYLNQTASRSISEILIVDDGSTDSTADAVAELAANSFISIRYLRQKNKGPASARNFGIREAKSEIILFTDDDVIPGPTLVAEHIESHERVSEVSLAVLGHLTWALEIDPTPFMNWYGSEALFAYGRLKVDSWVGYPHFYTCNLSIRADFLRSNGTFDEEFKVAAWEDVELGYRLQKTGMRLLYNPRAVAYHYQSFSFDQACQRARKAGLAREIFERKEAGMHYYSSLGASNEFFLKQPYRSWALRCAMLALAPFKRVMDWRMPLPRPFYRTLFRLYCR